MIRKGKSYVRPKKAYEKSRMEEENKLAEKYGLKNKREIWKTIAKVSYFRRRAKALAKSSNEEQEVLFNKLQNIGLNVNTISEVLALNVENLLSRRIQTVLAHKKLALTVRHARQLIVHKKVMINGNIISIPSYIVSVEDEKTLSLRKENKAPKAVKKEETSEVIQ
ncbi:MAG: 30S ribosomal protein S4 [Nanoarchaeota archaeon]